jgi:hypothetical protein
LLFVVSWWQSWTEVDGNRSGGGRQRQRSSNCGSSDSHGWQDSCRMDGSYEGDFV